jgi:hypothetical protein
VKHWLFVAKGETLEVSLFIRLGLSPKQAVEFLRRLDDSPIVGITGIGLARRVVALIEQEQASLEADNMLLAEYDRATKEVDIKQNMLFTD